MLILQLCIRHSPKFETKLNNDLKALYSPQFEVRYSAKSWSYSSVFATDQSSILSWMLIPKFCIYHSSKLDTQLNVGLTTLHPPQLGVRYFAVSWLYSSVFAIVRIHNWMLILFILLSYIRHNSKFHTQLNVGLSSMYSPEFEVRHFAKCWSYSSVFIIVRSSILSWMLTLQLYIRLVRIHNWILTSQLFIRNSSNTQLNVGTIVLY